MKNTLHSKKRNATCAFFKIIKPLFFYFFAVAFLWIITTAYAMRKTAESKISLSLSKNVALSVFTMDHCVNSNTLKTSFDAVMMKLLLELLHFRSLLIAQKLPLTLNASGSGPANYSAVLIYATAVGYFYKP